MNAQKLTGLIKRLAGTVDGVTVYVNGIVLDGIAKIGTFFM